MKNDKNELKRVKRAVKKMRKHIPVTVKQHLTEYDTEPIKIYLNNKTNYLLN